MNAIEQIQHLALLRVIETGKRYMDCLHETLNNDVSIACIFEQIIKTDKDLVDVTNFDMNHMIEYAEYKAKMMKARLE